MNILTKILKAIGIHKCKWCGELFRPSRFHRTFLNAYLCVECMTLLANYKTGTDPKTDAKIDRLLGWK